MERIITYMIEDLGMNERSAKRNALKLGKYDDIKEEFLSYIENEEYPENGIIIEDYSAQDIHKMTDRLNPVGVYNFLVSLRETPDIAKKIIADGFPVK